jgi:hypothetical protein
MSLLYVQTKGTVALMNSVVIGPMNGLEMGTSIVWINANFFVVLLSLLSYKYSKQRTSIVIKDILG